MSRSPSNRLPSKIGPRLSRGLVLATALMLGTGCGGPAPVDPPGSAQSTDEGDTGSGSVGDAAAPPGAVEIREIEEPIAGENHFRLEAGPVNGRTVLLLHGGRFHSGTWRELGTIERLASAGFRVIAVDLPGFGRSPSTALPRGEWLARFLESAKLERIALLAASMSGSFALPFLGEHPKEGDPVAAFIAVAPVGIDDFARDVKAPLPIPAWLLWGEDDRTIPLEGAKRLRGEFVEAELTVYEGASHPCYLDEPERFHEDLVRFLEGALRQE